MYEVLAEWLNLLFSAIYTKRDHLFDCLSAYLKDEILPDWGPILKERICSSRSKFFPSKGDPNEMGGK